MKTASSSQTPFLTLPTIGLLVALPLLGTMAASRPIGRYLEFPPLTHYVEHAGFALPTWIGLALLILFVVLPFIIRIMWSNRTANTAPGEPSARKPEAPPLSPPLLLSNTRRFPIWGWMGLAFGIGAWVLAWNRFEWFAPLQDFTFSPLWLGYIITVNALTHRRTGQCMLTQRPRYLVSLFVASAAFWWLFEYLNRFVQNWYYIGIGSLTPLEYFVFATLPFSTVLPAVMGTFQLLATYPRLYAGLTGFLVVPRINSRYIAIVIFVLSAAGLAGIGLWPDYLFPLLWLAPLGVLASLLIMTGRTTLFANPVRGDWRRVVLLALSGLICGFFWEMWNFYSLAKWIYAVPFVNRFHIFEMPALGYAGYLPFGLECALIADLLCENGNKMKNILAICVPLLMILALGCSTPGVRVTDNSFMSAQHAATSNQVQQLTKRIEKLEKAQSKNRVTEFRKRFEAQMAIDRTIYSIEERREIESLYQEANKQRNSIEKRQRLETLIDNFPEANRAGCAVLYLGQMAEGQEREAYLRRAIDEYSDCWYGDGVQVGAYARFYLAWDCLHAGKTTGAERLFEELRKGFTDAIDHQGRLLFDRIPKPANTNDLPSAGKATVQSASAPTKCASTGGSIRGTVRDGTSDYSERQFRNLECVVTQTIAKRGRDEAGRDESIMKALMELIGPHGPMSNVTVTLRSISTTPEAREFLLKTATDSKGNFSFPNVREGEYMVTAEIRRGWLAGRTEVQRQVEHYRTFDSVDLVFHPNPVVIRGKITDTSGRPLASVKMTATQCGKDDNSGITAQSHVVSGVSDRAGSYELRGLLPGNAYSGPEQYKIRAEVEGYVAAEMKIPIMNEDVRAATERLWRISLQLSGPERQTRLAEWKANLPTCRGNTITGIDLVLDSSSLLSGQVTDPQNKPQPACYVWLIPVKNIPSPITTNALLPKPVLADAQGAFEFHGVPAGSYTFRIGKDNRYVNVEAAHVTVREGAATTGLQLKFDVQPLGRIEATVCELETGKPIADFSASVWQVLNPREYSSARGKLNKNSAGSGTFAVENISPGKAEIEITAPGHAPEHLHIDVPPGQTAPLHVRMARAGVARIRVTQDGAQIEPMDNFQAFSADTGAVTYGRRTSQGAGWYEIPGLKAGRYTIRGHVSNGQRSIRYETASVVIEADKTSDVTLDFGGNSGLAITLAFPSGLTAQAWIEASDAPAGQPMEKNLDMCAYLWADWPGDYNAKHLRPGTYRVCARLIDPKKDKTKKTKLPPEQSQTVILKEEKTSAVQFRF